MPLLALGFTASAEEAGGAAAAEHAETDQFSATVTNVLVWVERNADPLVRWYQATPPLERLAWVGLAACAVLGSLTLLNRLFVVRAGRVIPEGYRERFHVRLMDSRLDWAQGIDYCELNPSPAARVALAAIQRWGRPIGDMERGVSIARRIEVDALRRHVGTLRRVAAMAPLVGLLGTLASAGRMLASLPAGEAWGPAVAESLAPLTASVGLAILALLFYDGFTGRIESLANELDRLGAETVDALAMAANAAPTRQAQGGGSSRRVEPANPPRPPHAGPLSLGGSNVGAGQVGRTVGHGDA